MYSFGMVLWEIATDGEIPFNTVQFDFEVRDRVVRGERPRISASHKCPEPFETLITKCWSQDPTHRPSATQATASLTTLLESIGTVKKHASKQSDSGGSSSSVSPSFRATHSDRDHRHHSFLGTRITNLFRGRFSARSSTRSDAPDEMFAKYTSPFSSGGSLEKSPVDGVAILGLPPSQRRGGFTRGFAAALPSLSEYDMEATPSDISTTFSSSSAESIMSPIVELPVDAMLDASGTFIDDTRIDNVSCEGRRSQSSALADRLQCDGDIQDFGGAYVGTGVARHSHHKDAGYFAFV